MQLPDLAACILGEMREARANMVTCNPIVKALRQAGRFWGATPTSGTELSVEEGFAEQLGWEVGDTVSFDIAGHNLG